MKQTMFNVQIRQPESRLELERRKWLRRAEVVYGVLTWILLIGALLAAVAGIIHNFNA